MSSSSWRYKREIGCDTPEMTAPIQTTVVRATCYMGTGPVAVVGPTSGPTGSLVLTLGLLSESRGKAYLLNTMEKV